MKTIFKVFSADMAAKFITMITTILLVRVMNSHDYANYTVIVAATNIFNQIAISSFGKMYIVDYEKIKGIESTLLLVEMVLSIIITTVFCFVQPSTRNNIIGLFFLMLTTCIFGFARVIYQQQFKFRIYTLLEIIRVVLFFLIIAITFWGFKVNLTSRIVVLIQSISLIAVLPLLLSHKSKIDWKRKIELKKILCFVIQKEQLYLFVYAALMAILLQIDVLALKSYSTDYYVSTYSSALKYYNMMLMLLSTVNSVLLPKISMEDDYRKIKKMYRQQDLLSLVLLVGIITAIISAPFILPIIDGGKYPESIRVFQILCISALISFWGSPYNNLLIKEKRYLSICIRFAIGIIVAIIGNYIFIPILNVNGTAYVTLFSYGIVNLSSRFEAKIIIKNKIKEQENVQ